MVAYTAYNKKMLDFSMFANKVIKKNNGEGGNFSHPRMLNRVNYTTYFVYKTDV